MEGWMYLPRYIDKIRLHFAGKLHADYRDNFGKAWTNAGLKPPAFLTNKCSRW
jgi:hypothetical protein